MLFKLELWIGAVLLMWSMVNAGYSYWPIHQSGSFTIPHSEWTVTYGVDPAAVSKMVIPASALRRRS